jgi:hypothetical protein
MAYACAGELECRGVVSNGGAVTLPRNGLRFAYCANGYMEDSHATLYRKALR